MYELKKFQPTIQITQGHYHRPLLENLKAHLNAGHLIPSANSLEKKGIKPPYTAKDMVNLPRGVDFRIKSAPYIRSKLIPILDQFNFYSLKGIRYSILKELINIYYAETDIQLRTEKMEPLIKKLHNKSNKDSSLTTLN